MFGINVDADVYWFLTAQKKSEATSYNQVLRNLIGPGPLDRSSTGKIPDGWNWRGIYLPNGTKLRAEHSGNILVAEIRDDLLYYSNTPYKSPSAAAYAAARGGANGWKFWSVKRPGDNAWFVLDDLRMK